MDGWMDKRSERASERAQHTWADNVREQEGIRQHEKNCTLSKRQAQDSKQLTLSSPCFCRRWNISS
eukprot:3058688-Rhodomonas_salina.3